MRVLSIDPAVRNTGYAVLEGDPRKPTVLAFDVISIPKTIAQSAALSAIRTHLVNITLTQPRLVGWRRPLFWNQWFAFSARSSGASRRIRS